MSTIYKDNTVAYVKYTIYGRLIPNSLTIGTSVPKDDSKTMYRQVDLYIDAQDFVPLPSIVICNKTWTSENLDVTTYANSDTIPQITDSAEWAAATTGAWCYPNNDPALGAIYGKLYNHYAVADPRGLAPDGWHIPVVEEWISLIGCTGGIPLGTSGQWSITGKKLKEVGTTHWASPNIATNSTGFTAFGTGVRRDDGAFDGGTNYSGTTGYPDLPPYQSTGFWAKETYATVPGLRVPAAAVFTLFHANDVYQKSFYPETWGFPVRLVKNPN